MTKKRVGVFVRLTSGYEAGLLRGVLAYAADRPEWELQLPVPGLTAVELLARGHLQGILGDLDGQTKLRFLVGRSGVPWVALGQSAAAPRVSQVMVDDGAVGRVAAEHLVGRGFDELAYLGYPGERMSDERYEGFRAGVVAARRHCRAIEPAPGVSLRHREHAPAVAAVRRWLKELARPVGLFAATDALGRLACGLCCELGIRVPEQVAIVGVGDDEAICQTCRPALSSVPLDGHSAGYAAAGILDGMMQAGRRRRQGQQIVRIGPRPAVVRQSSDVFATADKEMSAAARFVAEHRHELISVEDILRAVPMARRSLERRFKQAFGRTPLQEIVRAHVQEAQRLLSETNLPMPRVAAAAGFANAQQLSVVFSREVGEPPTRYRARFRQGSEGTAADNGRPAAEGGGD